MSNSLIPLENADLIPYDEKEIEELTGGIEYLARVQLVASTSALVGAGFPPGNWVYVRSKDDVEDLGKEFRAIVVAVQAKAARLVAGQAPDFTTDMHSQKYQEFKLLAKTTKNQGYLYGPEFLLYIAKLNTFATLHCSNDTSRKASKHLIDLIGNGAKISSTFLKNQKGQWFGPVFVPDSTPFDTIPTQEEIKDALNKFRLTAPAPTLQEAENTENERPR